MEKGMVTRVNEIYRAHFGQDMTEEEAWQFVDFMKDVFEGLKESMEKELEKR